ncbi:mechanosensitive ion channel protein [Desulfoluna limicola]|uniref:Mechanosensitive ion channel protein n=2 Tax=Desulfoluna limicola TaxID=2810562 RepID=A0ABM7PNQ0_9BACT|nr:mechanosensitive ion channel protein [Desulfoluna limicola]
MFMEAILLKGQELLAFYGLKVVAALAIFIIGRIAAGMLRGVLKKMMEKGQVEPTLTSFICSVSYVAMLAFVIIAALGKLGVQTASFVAVLGAAGLAVGLALQGSLSNFASGVLLVIFTPFKVGDYVEAGGTSGTVEEISIFSTIIKSPDNKRIIVPNASVTGANIINHTANDQRRVDLVVGVGYGDDIDLVRTTLQEILAKDDRLLAEPAPTIGVVELAESSVNLVVRPWVKTADYWAVYFDLNEAIKKTFDEKGISIPFPQRDLHLTMDGAALEGIATLRSAS